MALSRTGDLVDPYGGEDDLKSRQLRHVSGAFNEDPLRVLRGVRFLAQLGRFEFHIAQDTVLLMQAMSQSLRELSVERIIVELDKMLASNHPELGLGCLNHLGITDALAPALNILPDQFIGQSTDVRLAEWLLLNRPTIECIERYGKEFRLTNKRVLFLKAATRLKDLTFEDAGLCLDVFFQIGWLRGNPPDKDLDRLLIELDDSSPMTIPVRHWLEIRERLRGVSVEHLIKEGLSGKALRDAIYNERLTVLSTEISAPGTAPGL